MLLTDSLLAQAFDVRERNSNEYFGHRFSVCSCLVSCMTCVSHIFTFVVMVLTGQNLMIGCL